MVRVFISYSHVDRPFLDAFITRLRRIYRDFEFWFDDELRGGDEWWAEIVRQIHACDIFIYLLSNESVQSEYCQKEYAEAKQYQKQILPIQVRARTQIPPELGRIQFVDLSNGLQNIDDLVAAIQNIIDKLPQSTSQPEGAPPSQQAVPTPVPDASASFSGNSSASNNTASDNEANNGSLFQRLTQPQAVILAALITTLIGGIFTILVALIEKPPEPPSPTPTPTVTATTMPSATATTEPTLTPAASPQAALNLEPYTNFLLNDRVIFDVAVGGDEVYFATNNGLIHYNAETELTREVSTTLGQSIHAIATDPTGEEVWFNWGDTQIARYLLRQDRVDQFSAPSPGLQGINFIEFDDDKTVWIGIHNNSIISFAALRTVQDWTFITGAVPTFATLDDMHVTHFGGLPYVRIIGFGGVEGFLFWREGNWSRLTPLQDICNEVNCVLNLVVGDASGRTWFGTSQGITVLSDDIRGTESRRCTARDTGLNSDIFLDAAVQETPQVLWAVTRAELARLDLSTVRFEDCSTWQWSHWEDQSFLLEAPGSDYRLAISETSNDTNPNVWLIEYGTNRVRTLR